MERRRGRPKKPDAGAPHTRRPSVSPEHPLHVTVRVRRGTWNLRSQRSFRRIAASLERVRDRSNFRVVHYSVQGNHMHLLVEANDRRALSNGMRALLISMARRLNVMMETSGPRFADRFHQRALTTRNAVRVALRYVLTTAAKHGTGPVIDPYSSGPWCDGVARPKWLPCAGPPTSPPESTLLKRATWAAS